LDEVDTESTYSATDPTDKEVDTESTYNKNDTGSTYHSVDTSKIINAKPSTKVLGQAEPRYTYAQFTIKTQNGLDTTVCADSGYNNTIVDKE
jgi:hypothetical protein